MTQVFHSKYSACLSVDLDHLQFKNNDSQHQNDQNKAYNSHDVFSTDTESVNVLKAIFERDFNDAQALDFNPFHQYVTWPVLAFQSSHVRDFPAGALILFWDDRTGLYSVYFLPIARLVKNLGLAMHFVLYRRSSPKHAIFSSPDQSENWLWQSM